MSAVWRTGAGGASAGMLHQEEESTPKPVQHAISRGGAPKPVQHAISIGRQPVVNRDGEVFGFELVYRGGPGAEPADCHDAEIATARLIAAAFMDFGIEWLVGSGLAFIDVSPPFLTGALPLPMPPEQVALQLREETPIGRPLLEGLRRLRRRGFTIVIDDFHYRANSAPLLTVADYVKLNIHTIDEAALREPMRHLDFLGVKVTAGGVDSAADRAWAAAFNVSLFQGPLIGPTQVQHCRLLPLHRDVAAVADRLLAWPQPNVARLTRVLVQDPVLVFRLLRFANIATFAGRGEVHSVTALVESIGIDAISEWARLFRLASVPYPDGRPGARDALLRARICAVTARREARCDPDAAFLAGLLHGIEQRLAMSTEELIDSLPVSGDVKLALASRSGPVGEVLAATLAWEAQRGRDTPQDAH